MASAADPSLDDKDRAIALLGNRVKFVGLKKAALNGLVGRVKNYLPPPVDRYVVELENEDGYTEDLDDDLFGQRLFRLKEANLGEGRRALNNTPPAMAPRHLTPPHRRPTGPPQNAS